MTKRILIEFSTCQYFTVWNPTDRRSLLVDDSADWRKNSDSDYICLLCLCPNVGCLSQPRSGLTCTRSPRAGHWTSSRESWKCSASQHLVWRCALFKVHCHRSSDEVKSTLYPHKLQVSLPCMNVFVFIRTLRTILNIILLYSVNSSIICKYK